MKAALITTTVLLTVSAILNLGLISGWVHIGDPSSGYTAQQTARLDALIDAQ